VSGKMVKVDLGMGFNVEVFVTCNPNTDDVVLQLQAKRLLRNALEPKRGIHGLGDSLRVISEATDRLVSTK
jgi:hypothetical protein